MKPSSLAMLITCFLAFASIKSHGSIDVNSYIGKAYDIETNELIYTEFQEEIVQDGKTMLTTVTYKDPKDNTLVKKSVDFSPGPWQPTFRMEDQRDGYLEGAEWRNDILFVLGRENDQEPLEEEKLESEQPLVIDAGFDLFVRDNWENLLAGQEVEFNFVAPARFDTFEFQVSQAKSTNYRGRQAQVFEMRPTSRFLSFLIGGSIMLTYDQETRRILEYSGLSNIRKDIGKSNYKVRIEYEYPDLVD